MLNMTSSDTGALTCGEYPGSDQGGDSDGSNGGKDVVRLSGFACLMKLPSTETNFSLCLQVIMKEHIRTKDWSPTPSTSYSDFLEVLEAADKKLHTYHQSYKRSYYEELVGRAKQKAEESDKRKRRARDEFASFLRHAKGIYHDTPWEDFEATFEKEPEFKAVSGTAKHAVETHETKHACSSRCMGLCALVTCVIAVMPLASTSATPWTLQFRIITMMVWRCLCCEAPQRLTCM